MSDQRKIRLIFTNKVYKKKGTNYHIPVMFKDGKYLTGQPGVSFEEATGAIPVSDDNRKRYPFIINPLEIYKVQDMKWFVVGDPSDDALLTLLRLSAQIAESKNDYELNKGKYVGYLEDVLKDAVVKNKKRSERYLAETEVMNSSIEDLIRTGLLLNYKVKGISFNPTKVSKIELEDRILSLCETHPEIVKSCYKKYNDNVNHESFGVELLHYGVIRRDRDGSIYEGSNYLCQTVESLREYISRKENSTKVDKWTILLKEAKGKAGVNISNSDDLKPERIYNASNINPVNDVKVALFENNLSKAKLVLAETKSIASIEQIEEMKSIIAKYEEAEVRKEGEGIGSKELPKYDEMEVSELQEVITRMKHKSWKLSEVKDKSDKSSLLEYINFKLSNN